jgi:excisionase family DNA binding protein
MGHRAEEDPMLSTGEAARVLGVSRQHVVNLCDRGLLEHSRVGKHRRLRRSDVVGLLPAPTLRDVERLAWLHSAVAGRLVLDPDRVLRKARVNLARLRQVHPRGGAASLLAEWGRILDRGPDAALEALTSRSPKAAELRQSSPFAGVLTQSERRRILESFREHWRTEHER